MKVLVSNGMFKFHLAAAAAQLHEMNVLEGLLTGGYPTRGVKSFCQRAFLRDRKPVLRLLSREERIPETLVHANWVPELLTQAARTLASRVGRGIIASDGEALAMKIYGGKATQVVRASGARIYHYRAGYGGKSVAVARAKGMITLCDHSIAHPALVDYMVEHDGCYPEAPLTTALGRFWTNILEDIRRADHLLVNSEFVKQTFEFQGWQTDRIDCIYLGVDEQFVGAVAPRVHPEAAKHDRSLRLMYAGGLIPRKGFDKLVAALSDLAGVDWRLTIAGPGIDAAQARFGEFFANPRVRYVGNLSRDELAREMSKADVFVFPSLVEGSARVVFEALACGCFVITTRNAGSIVEDGVHGALVDCGDVEQLARAIRRCADDLPSVARVGAANQRLILEEYDQKSYGDKLLRLYEKLGNTHRPG